MHIFNCMGVSTPNPCVVQSSTVWRSGTYIILFSFIFAYLNSFNCSIIQRISRDNSFQTSFYIYLFLGFTGNIKTNDISNDQALKTWNHILFSPCNLLQPLQVNCIFSISSTFGSDMGAVWDGNLKAGNSFSNLWSPSIFFCCVSEFFSTRFSSQPYGLIKSHLCKLLSIQILCWYLQDINWVN